MQYWILSDIKRGLINFVRKKPKENIHIMFAFVDHFEPGSGNASIEQQRSKVGAWVERYPELVSNHRDSDGVCPQHTFFFPPHYDTHDHLERIVYLCSCGFGEVEMHLHHDKQEPWPDDELSLKKKILDCIKAYSKYGVFCLPDGRKAYGFIHGDWALANSLNRGQHCGINDELSILKKQAVMQILLFRYLMKPNPNSQTRYFFHKAVGHFQKVTTNLHFQPKWVGRIGKN